MWDGVGLIVIGLEFSPRKDKFINFHESVISKQLWKKKTRAELIAAMRHVAVAESFANWKLSKTNRKQFLLLAFSWKMKIFECDVEFESAEADEGSEDEVFDGTSDFDASASKIFRLIKDTSVLQRMEILRELPSNDLVAVMKKFQEKKI